MLRDLPFVLFGLVDFPGIETVQESGRTFVENASLKGAGYAEQTRLLTLADDSGLEVDPLDGAPGVHSARYAADEPHAAETNTDDEANNAKLIREINKVSPEKRTGRFVCWIAVARDGKTLAVFEGKAEGVILEEPRGTNGFGYDPLFYFPEIGKTFAELSAEEKAKYSHRGTAFRKFLEWYKRL